MMGWNRQSQDSARKVREHGCRELGAGPRSNLEYVAWEGADGAFHAGGLLGTDLRGRHLKKVRGAELGREKS